ncbi:MAG TPA: hypothetical protein VLA45_06595 [Paracoccaceae bacterium]|nr:hypothetical protein [Paracoccaceae bacterium]
MRADGDIQFAPVDIPVAPAPQPSEPGWLANLFEWIANVLEPLAGLAGGNWPVIKWVLLALVVALLLYAVWRLIGPIVLAARVASDDDSGFVPDQTQALQLLEDADRLASEGRFDEATHLLLQRSVGQIAQARPDLIDPSSTAREISALPALPAKAAHAFATIAERVERSLFALRILSADDWHAARAAYAEFALGYAGVARGVGS